MIPETVHHIANAIQHASQAWRDCDIPEVSDYISVAEENLFHALRALADSQVDAPVLSGEIEEKAEG